MRPACWNREAFTDPNAGWYPQRLVMCSEVDGTGNPIGLRVKKVLRYQWPWFTDRCTVHDKADIGPGLTYAQHHGWEAHCKTCRWYPVKESA